MSRHETPLEYSRLVISDEALPHTQHSEWASQGAASADGESLGQPISRIALRPSTSEYQSNAPILRQEGSSCVPVGAVRRDSWPGDAAPRVIDTCDGRFRGAVRSGPSRRRIAGECA